MSHKQLSEETAPAFSSPVTFTPFPKMARLSREAVITEKIDGTNAQIFIWDEMHTPEARPGEFSAGAGSPPVNVPWLWSNEGVHVAAGSRTRWITLGDDNFGFARWVLEHVEQLVYLKHGRHFGEWWGSGIQRGYGLPKGEKRFSLFNTARWAKQTPKSTPPLMDKQQHCPDCCHVVPILHCGVFSTIEANNAVEWLRTNGSLAAPGFRNPEGIVVFHTASGALFKKTLHKDDQPKSLAQ